jgi:hypothetical protein
VRMLLRHKASVFAELYVGMTTDMEGSFIDIIIQLSPHKIYRNLCPR